MCYCQSDVSPKYFREVMRYFELGEFCLSLQALMQGYIKRELIADEYVKQAALELCKDMELDVDEGDVWFYEEIENLKSL